MCYIFFYSKLAISDAVLYRRITINKRTYIEIMWLHKQSTILKGVSNNIVLNLIVNYGLIVGCIGGVCVYGSFPLFYLKFKKDAAEYQTYTSIMFLPWACKALVGALSDSYPIFGWHKRWLLIGANITLFMSLIGVGTSQSSFDALGFLLLASVCIMTNNTLWEGQYAMMTTFARADPRGVSFSWGCYMLGLGLGACVIGPLGSNVSMAFFIAAPLALIPVVPLITMPEETLPGDRKGTMTTPALLNEDRKESIRTSKPKAQEWSLILWITTASILLIILLLSTNPNTQSFFFPVTLAIFIIFVSIASLYAVYFKEQPVITALCVFSLMHQIFYINLEGVTTAYYTASNACWYGAPGFSLVFFYTVVQVISSIVGVAAAGLHAGVFSKWDTRSAEINAIVFRIFTGVFDLIIVQNWNEKYLHIGDKAFYIMGDAIASEAAIILVMLPLKTLCAKIIPMGRATTSYALLDSFQFLGISISRILGIGLANSFDVRASKLTGCDFTQFAVILALAHMVFPILSLSLAWLVIPRIKIGVD